MNFVAVILIPVAAVLRVQLASVCGRTRGSLLGVAIAAALGTGWWLLGAVAPPDAGPRDWAGVASVPSTACARCHADHYESWYRTYHRTMTREATAENVKGDFANAVYDYQGVPTKLFRSGDAYFMETADPGWALVKAKAGGRAPPPQFAKYRVDRLVGSHWIQECLHKDAGGQYQRLPVLYHIVEQRWVHTNGAFLAPDSDDFWDKCRGVVWNNSCLYCHNTGPASNPVRGPRGQVVGYHSEVAELGISCEACHGPGGEHVRLNHNPARRLALQGADGDPSIVNPARLSVPRRDEVCGRCHGALVPKSAAWDARTHRDPFVPGLELTRFNHLFWSEAEQASVAGHRPDGKRVDGRFWGDGTPLTTALEYNALALSRCYENGRGNLSCLSCHTMHGDDPNFLLKPGMKTNEACYQCHDGYRTKLADHTHHAADSPGSLCYNCHMPHVVYSLLTTHRSHRIESPSVQATLATGKPHACNLCHLDKSLGWTQQQLAGWSGKKSVGLPAEEETLASALLLMARGDARSRVMVAGAFSNPAAQRASGTDWFAPFLTRLIEDERYPAVRYLAHRGLRSAHGDAAAGPYNYLAVPAERSAQLRALRERAGAVSRPLPHLPLTPQGLPDEAVLRRLREKRQDPDLTINE